MRSGIGCRRFHHKVYERSLLNLFRRRQFLHTLNTCCLSRMRSLLILWVSAYSRLSSSRQTRHPLLDPHLNSSLQTQSHRRPASARNLKSRVKMEPTTWCSSSARQEARARIYQHPYEYWVAFDAGEPIYNFCQFI
jgi:hypothetical protein